MAELDTSKIQKIAIYVNIVLIALVLNGMIHMGGAMILNGKTLVSFLDTGLSTLLLVASLFTCSENPKDKH